MPFTMPGKKRPLGGGTSSPAPAASSGGAPAAASAGQQAATPGYVNFSRLLAVNQGGAQKMADGLAAQAQSQGQQAVGAMDAAKATFQDKVQGGTLSYQKPTVARTSGPASGDLYKLAGAMQAQAGRSYEGPKDWDAAGLDTTALAEQARGAQQTATSLTSAGGRGALLRASASGPYTAGMSSLDSALSGAALGDRGAQLASLYGGLSQQLIDYRKAGGVAVDAATAASTEAVKQYAADADNYQRAAQQAQATEESWAAQEAERRRRGLNLAPGYLNRGITGGYVGGG